MFDCATMRRLIILNVDIKRAFFIRFNRNYRITTMYPSFDLMPVPEL